MIQDAQDALDLLIQGKQPSSKQRAALERAIRFQRPAPCCVANGVTPLGAEAPYNEPWTTFQPSLQRLQASVARLERVDGTDSYPTQTPMGTGFLVAPDLILTARHVVDQLSHGAMHLEPGDAVANFGEYDDHASNEVCGIVAVAAVDPQFDLALLRLEPAGGGPRPPITFESGPLEVGTPLCVVGYPLYDDRSGPVNVSYIFGNQFGVKRAAVGEVIRSTAEFAYHDCSTLGGNSGSPAIDLATGLARGVHVSGRALKRNLLVRAAHAQRLIDRYFEGSDESIRPQAVASVPLFHGYTPVEPESDDEMDTLEARPEDYRERPGYNELFLGPRVPLPTITRDEQDVLTYTFEDRERSVLPYQNFAVLMSRSRRMCRYSACNIDGRRSTKRPRTGWRFDPRIPKEAQIREECYGLPPRFSRGHMTRREDPVWGSDEEASRGNADSMHVTNAVPQMQPFNAGIWLQLENYALDNTREDAMRVSVFTGPFFSEDDPEHFGIAIPLEFWKIIAFIHDGTGDLTATGYTMSQASFIEESEHVFGQHQNRQRSIAEIQRRTGLHFGGLADVDPMRDVPESADRLLIHPAQIRFV